MEDQAVIANRVNLKIAQKKVEESDREDQIPCASAHNEDIVNPLGDMLPFWAANFFSENFNANG